MLGNVYDFSQGLRTCRSPAAAAAAATTTATAAALTQLETNGQAVITAFPFSLSFLQSGLDADLGPGPVALFSVCNSSLPSHHRLPNPLSRAQISPSQRCPSLFLPDLLSGIYNTCVVRTTVQDQQNNMTSL